LGFADDAALPALLPLLPRTLLLLLLLLLC
jgi:hypothetical protein